MPAVDYEKLAGLYDSLVRTDEDVAFFVSLSERAPGGVVELMAGTGRVSIPVAAAGVDLTCVDSSPAMLEVLGRKLLERRVTARVVHQDVTELELKPRFALAFIAFHSFEELTEDEARLEALRRILEHLVPGGMFVCTLHDPAIRLGHVGPGREIRRRFTVPPTGRQIELILSSTFDEDSSLVRGREQFRDLRTDELIADLPLCFRLTDEEGFRCIAEEAGFHVTGLFGDYLRGPYVAGANSSMIWMLRRPELS